MSKRKRTWRAADTLADLLVRLSVRSMATRCRLAAMDLRFPLVEVE